MASNDHYVIAGNGPAGNAALNTLRKNDPESRITIISDESVGFYSKPRLCSYISGRIEEDELFIHEDLSFDNTRLRLGQHIQSIDPDQKIIFLSHMEKINYTKLIIASGSKPSPSPYMTQFMPYLKSITDFHEAKTHKQCIHDAQQFLVLGGDLVGFKFIDMLISMGKAATLILYPQAFWPFVLDSDMVDRITASLEPKGIRIMVNDRIQSIQDADGGYQVATLNHARNEIEEHYCDQVFAFSGMTPNIDFACKKGFDIDHGILVNEYLRTRFQDVYACGSCAQIFNPILKVYQTTIGWTNAETQGEIAALNLLGANQVTRLAPQKYFDLEGVKIKTSWWDDTDENPNPDGDF
ncbi:MAG: hypothetical protein D3926_17775 [Desulfobacteraceae bacterium]|nr:MAG: hypothetical protein D3926_17775 [Desulfobacteraceae bacterium]